MRLEVSLDVFAEGEETFERAVGKLPMRKVQEAHKVTVHLTDGSQKIFKDRNRRWGDRTL